MLAAPRQPPTPFLAILHAALLSRVRLLAGSARQKRVGEIELAWATCAMPRRSSRSARFGSYVTGYLPRSHPLVDNETLDDRALDGVWLGNDLTTPMFWMYSFKLRKVARLSDPRH